MTGVPPGAYATALTMLPGVGPVGLASLLDGRSPEEAWGEVRAGRVTRPARRAGPPSLSWDQAAARIDPVAMWRRCGASGIGVTWIGDAAYPQALRDDPQPPAVLFWRGHLDALGAPCVALIGTRRPTPDGRAMARELGRDVAAAGVCVVSGLALGIDGAAHAGALETGRAGATAGVAASGVDVPYPREHSSLWAAVAAGGVVVSETPPGRPAQRWRFPARNRIIAGLVSLVVVVESHERGGSLITVDAALERGVEVRAVPGSVRSPASAGTNQLLYDGPGPVRNAADVLDVIRSELDRTPNPARRATPGSAPPPDGRPDLDTEAASVLDVLDFRPTSFNRVVAAAGGDVGGVAAALERLVAAGLVTEERGWWQRRG